ncbi:MAG: Lrp/AsnC family transcriptional regulator [Sphingomonadales bacterium]|jgi:Lrp/AsnC family transcriptional regulator
MVLDKIDSKILALLQKRADRSIADIAQEVGLSTTPCWRRIQAMEKAGIIKRRVALLDRKALGLNVDVFVQIRTRNHDISAMTTLSEKISDFEEVVGFYRMAGDMDYLLHVVVPDIPAFDAFYKALIARVSLDDVSSSFAMEEIKYTTALPLPK